MKRLRTLAYIAFSTKRKKFYRSNRAKEKEFVYGWQIMGRQLIE
jgi:hypothetical protein